jgi:hypothetical protein
MSSITSHWNIVALDTIPSLDNLTNVISVIHCEKLAVSEDGFNARWYGTVSVAAPHTAAFTPYEEVTEEMVIGWVEESLHTIGVDDNLVAQIDNQRNPPIVTLPLPWAPAPVAPEMPEAPVVPVEPAEPEVQL